jgi:putative ABC transport system substrate-binding protein
MKRINRNVFCAGALLFALCLPAEAQQGKKVPRIGYLSGSAATAMSRRTEAFQHGLRDLGYVEGKNIVVEYRYGDRKIDRVPALAAELARLNG